MRVLHAVVFSCVHTGKRRPHPCTVAGCSASFNTPSALKAHAKVHLGKPLAVCVNVHSGTLIHNLLIVIRRSGGIAVSVPGAGMLVLQ